MEGLMYTSMFISVFAGACGIVLWIACKDNPAVPPVVRLTALIGVLLLAVFNVASAVFRQEQDNRDASLLKRILIAARTGKMNTIEKLVRQELGDEVVDELLNPFRRSNSSKTVRDTGREKRNVKPPSRLL
jgi:hypothetical protein